MQNQTIKLSPSPTAIIESLRSIGYTMETALADIIDNSISASAGKVDICFEWNDKDPWIAIIDDGSGMSEDKLKDAMRFGSLSPLVERKIHDLGRFGLGMKTASISQCRKLTVCSKYKGKMSACQWDLDVIAGNPKDDWTLRVYSDSDIKKDPLLKKLVNTHLDQLNTGTIVLWKNLDTILAGTAAVDSENKFSETMSLSRRHLETVFHRFIKPEIQHSSSVVRIRYNNSDLEAFDPFGAANNPARQELQEQEIPIQGNRIKIQPYVLPHKSKASAAEYEKYAGENGYLQNQGFYVYRNRRLIMRATWFRLIKKEELTKLIRVRIDIPNTLDTLWEINVNKSQVSPPDLVRRELKSIIKRISNKGKNTQGRRGKTKLKNTKLIQTWVRTITNNNVEYKINDEHPLVKDIIDSTKGKLRNKLKVCLQLISESFPKDIYYNDAANDDLSIKSNSGDDPELTKTLCKNLIEALLDCKIPKKELKNRMMETDIPGISEGIVDSILKEELRTPNK